MEPTCFIFCAEDKPVSDMGPFFLISTKEQNLEIVVFIWVLSGPLGRF